MRLVVWALVGLLVCAGVLMHVWGERPEMRVFANMLIMLGIILFAAYTMYRRD